MCEDNIYFILNIPENIILNKENNINHLLFVFEHENSLEKKLYYVSKIIEIVNKFHSYFHFEQSFCYTLYAYILHLKNDQISKNQYLSKALFQDRINSIALDFNNKIDTKGLLWLSLYNKNYQYESMFLQFAVGTFEETSEITLLDRLIKLVFDSKIALAVALQDEINYSSHRQYLIKSIIAINLGDLALAEDKIKCAINMLEDSHKKYHKYAAKLYASRAVIFEELGLNDLSKNDIFKFHDLMS